jgi:hypothetical protein
MSHKDQAGLSPRPFRVKAAAPAVGARPGRAVARAKNIRCGLLFFPAGPAGTKARNPDVLWFVFLCGWKCVTFFLKKKLKFLMGNAEKRDVGAF